VLARERRRAILGHAERLARMPRRDGRCNVAFVGRWARYWFAPGGRYTVAILRVVVAVSVLMSLLATFQGAVPYDSIARRKPLAL